MTTIADLQLSAELQELYLENKEWITQLQFLKDEYRFFIKLFNAEQNEAKKHSLEQALLVKNSLITLKEKIVKLDELTTKHQHLIESILKDQKSPIGYELIEQNTVIGKEIKLLLDSDRQIKKMLFSLVEEEKK